MCYTRVIWLRCINGILTFIEPYVGLLVKVFAVNDVVGMDGSSETGKSITAKTISLLVTPQQAAKVTLASQLGKILLVMRSPEDDEQVPDVQITPSELFGKAEKSQRDSESLMKDPETDKGKKGFLNYLDSMKRKLAAGAAPPTDAQSTWIMRVLRPGEVDEVSFEEGQSEPGSSAEQWKVKATSGNAAPRQPAMQPPGVVERSADERPSPSFDPQGPKLVPENK